MQQTQRRYQLAPYAAAFSVVLIGLMFLIRGSGAADEFAAPAGAAAPDGVVGLELEFVDAELALVEANLEYVLHRNRRSPGYYPDSFVEELRFRMTQFAEWSKQLKEPIPNHVRIDVLMAEADLKVAQMRLREDETVRDALPDTVSDAQIKRRRLAVEVAQSWLKRVTDPSFEKLTDAERNRWRLVMLRKEIIGRRIERCR